MVIFEDEDMLLQEILGIPIFMIVPGVAVTVGLGGGGLIVPTCMYVLSMTPKESTALSQALMFGAAVAGLLIDWNRKEQNFNVPIIDVELLVFMGPILMSGALVGGFVNRSSPDWFIVFALIIVLGISGVKTFQKGCQAKQKNRRDSTIRSSMGNVLDQGVDEDGDSFDEPQKTANGDKWTIPTAVEMVGGSTPKETSTDVVVPTKLDAETEARFEKFFVEEAPQISKNGWWTVFGLWAFSLAMLCIRGSPKNPSFVGLEAGSTAYWVLTIFNIIFLFSLGMYFGNRLVKRTRDADPEYVQFLFNKTCGTTTPKEWTMDNIYILAPCIFFAGIISGTVGIGGGMILGPLMLMVEVPAQVVASVNACSILLSASSLAALYLLDGAIDWTYALFYSFCCFVGAYIGKWKTKKYFAKHDYALVYIMAAITIVSWLLVFVKVIEEVQTIQDDGWEDFQKPE